MNLHPFILGKDFLIKKDAVSIADLGNVQKFSDEWKLDYQDLYTITENLYYYPV